MFDIYGVAPFQTVEKKITSRDSKDVAVEFATELASHGYTKVRVTQGEEGSAIKQANPPVEIKPHDKDSEEKTAE